MIHISQLDILAGNPRKNTESMLAQIEQTEAKNSDMLVFPEMAIPGYLLGDEWENESFVNEAESLNKKIIEATKSRSFAVVWGNVLTDSSKVNEDGRLRKYNALFVAKDGELIATRIKTLMPNYREFDDKRHFTSLRDKAFEEGLSLTDMQSLYEPVELVVASTKRKVAFVICEDMWDGDYPIKVVDLYKKNGADMVVNISASPFTVGKGGKRDRILEEKSKDIDFIYANCSGIQDNGKNIFVFDGSSVVYEDGKKQEQIPSFTDGVFGVSEHSQVSEISDTAMARKAIVYGLKKFLEKLGKKKVVIGLSGGIDSAVVAMLAVEAVGKENVIAVNMPSKYNSSTTKNLAEKLASELGIAYHVIPISESIEHTAKQIQDTFGITVSGLVEENIQARDRGGRILAAVAAALGAVFTNNGNKTEVAQGYATLYGDVNGAIAPIADRYKSEVFELARELNKDFRSEAIESILSIPPSAELSSAQNIEEGKGDPFQFEYHDKLLYRMIEMRDDPEKLLRYFIEGKLETVLGLTKSIIPSFFPSNRAFIDDIERIWKNYKNSFFKRVQSPPIIVVSKRAFGFDLRESQNGAYFTENYLKLKDTILR